MFIYLLNVFNGMPGGWCVEIVFYVCVLFAGLSSLVNLYEAPVEMMQERFGFRRKIAVAVIAMLGGIISLMIQGIVSGWMDAVSIYICPLGAMLAAIMFFWVAGRILRLQQLTKERKNRSAAGLCRLENMYWFRLRFSHLWRGRCLGELADKRYFRVPSGEI